MQAEDHLYFAFNNCHRNKQQNRNLIMNYLVPLRLLKGKQPIPGLLSQFSQLSELYQTFITGLFFFFFSFISKWLTPLTIHWAFCFLGGEAVVAVKLGNVELFDRHLTRFERQLMKRGTYLIVERESALPASWFKKNIDFFVSLWNRLSRSLSL